MLIGALQLFPDPITYGFGVASLIWVVVGLVIWASMAADAADNRDYQLRLANESKQDQAANTKAKFDYAVQAAGNLVDSEARPYVKNALVDLYQVQSAIQRYPMLADTRATFLAEAIGQTILAGSLRKEIASYTQSRLSAKSTLSKLVHLENEQTKQVADLGVAADELLNTVKENSL